MIMLRAFFVLQLAASAGAQYISTHGCSTLCLMQYSADDYEAGTRSPCGCGFVARTTRDQLQEMDMPALRKKLEEVEKDTTEVDSELKDTEAHNKKVAADKEGLVAKLEAEVSKTKDEIATKTKKMQNLKEQSTDDNEKGLKVIA